MASAIPTMPLRGRAAGKPPGAGRWGRPAGEAGRPAEAGGRDGDGDGGGDRDGDGGGWRGRQPDACVEACGGQR